MFPQRGRMGVGARRLRHPHPQHQGSQLRHAPEHRAVSGRRRTHRAGLPAVLLYTGNATAVSAARRMGGAIADELSANRVDGVLLVATLRSSCNRCGATLAKEIERAGIPVGMMTAMPAIPLSVGASRVVRGVRVPHVCGDRGSVRGQGPRAPGAYRHDRPQRPDHPGIFAHPSSSPMKRNWRVSPDET